MDGFDKVLWLNSCWYREDMNNLWNWFGS